MENKYKRFNIGTSDVCPQLTKRYINRNTKNKTQKADEKGITLVSLIVTIIIMIILASVTINVGTGSLENSRMLNFVSYMQTIQTKVDLIAENEDYLNYGQEIGSTQAQLLQDIIQKENLLTSTDSAYLRIFDSNKIASQLEIDNIDDEIVIDFNTREVISLKGIEYKDEMYYTQYNLPGGQRLIQKTEELERTVAFDGVEAKIDGLNATFIIKNIGITNGTLSYGKVDAEGNIKWTVVTNYTTKSVDVTTKNITETGTYYFKLKDNITGKENIDADGNYPSVNLKLTNTPKLEGNLTDLSTTYNYSNLNDSTKWAFATDTADGANLKYYVWIPRFAYQLNDEGTLKELQFLRGTSDVTTSGGYINEAEWTIPEIFINEAARTGVWVQVDTPKQSRCRYN